MRGKLILTAAALLGAVWFIPPVHADTVYLSDMPVYSTTIDSPIIYRRIESRVVEPSVVVDTTPTVITTPTMVSPSIVVPERSHFLRFGLGPLLDFGLF